MKKIGFFAPILITFTYSLLLFFVENPLSIMHKMICILGCYSSQYIIFKTLGILKEGEDISYLEYLFYLILPGAIYTIGYLILGKIGSGIVVYATGVVSAYALVGSFIVFLYVFTICLTM